MLIRLQAVSGLLGDEVVFLRSQPRDRTGPDVIARVLPGSARHCPQPRTSCSREPGKPRCSIRSPRTACCVGHACTPDLALGHLGQAAGSPFAAAINERYRRGALLIDGVDATVVVAMAAARAPPVELAAMMGTKYVFFDRGAPRERKRMRSPCVFDGERKGMAAGWRCWIRGAASTAVDRSSLYVSMSATVAAFPGVRGVEEKTGENVGGDRLSWKPGSAPVHGKSHRGAGQRSAFAVNGVSVSGPRWLMTALA